VRRLLRVAFCAALAASPAVALAQDGETVGLLRQLSYSASAGAMIPAGEEGQGLDPGPHMGGSIFYESGSGLSLGGELLWNRSTDPLRTNVLVLGALARISPRDYTAAYMRLGLGAYHVGYSVESPQLVEPGSTLRPGGSFGAGFEAIHTGKLAIGASLVYHGILLNSSDALSFVTAAVELTWRPYSF
jgi:hypothetical protein